MWSPTVAAARIRTCPSTSRLRRLDRDDGIGPGRDRGAGHDPGRCTGGDFGCRHRSCRNIVDDCQVLLEDQRRRRRGRQSRPSPSSRTPADRLVRRHRRRGPHPEPPRTRSRPVRGAAWSPEPRPASQRVAASARHRTFGAGHQSPDVLGMSGQPQAAQLLPPTPAPIPDSRRLARPGT